MKNKYSTAIDMKKYNDNLYLFNGQLDKYREDLQVVDKKPDYFISETEEKDDKKLKSDAMYQKLVTHMNEGLVITDEKNKFIFMNPKFCEMLGYTRKELMSMHFKDILDYENYKIFAKDIKTHLNKGKASRYELTFTAKTGKKLYCFVSVFPVIEKSYYKGSNIIATDLSELKEMEKKLLQAQKMEAIGMLAGGIAHDFNNILQTISGYTQILLHNKKTDEPEYKNLKAIEESAQKASSLTKQLLIFGRKNESQLKLVDLNNEINKISDILSRTLPKMIKIELSQAKNIKYINADPVQIEQIIMNIGLNAAHAMPNGGTLKIKTGNVSAHEICDFTLSSSGKKEYVSLSISDNGIGMNEEILKHIFEPFFTTKESGYGTGLGLAMVHNLVENHKGYITCRSNPGIGTVFTIYLPAIEKMTDKPDIKKTEEKELYRSNETILLVDDEEPLRKLGQELLKKQGFSVFVAKNGEMALNIFKEKIIDLVILDVSMPGMGGCMCFEELKRIDPHVKVIIVSGYSADGKVKEIINSGAVGFVGKPYRLDTLLNKIKETLNMETEKR